MSYTTRLLQADRDVNQWDKQLRDQRNGHMRHYSWWINALRKIGLEGFILATYHDTQIIGGAGVLQFNIPVIKRSVLLILHGPVFFENSEAAVISFCDKLSDEAQQRKTILLQFSAVPSADTLKIMKDYLPAKSNRLERLWNIYTTPDPYCKVDLDGQTESSIWDRFNQSTRRKIKKASRSELEITPVTTDEDFAKVHHTWQASGSRKGFLVRPLHSTVYTMSKAVENNMGMVLSARVEGEIVAGIFIVWAGCEAHYVSGGFVDRYSKYCPNHILHWETIRILLRMNLKSYNMGNYSEDGVGQFKRGFGAEINSINHHLAWIRHPYLWFIVKHLSSNRLGGMIRKLIKQHRGFTVNKNQLPSS